MVQILPINTTNTVTPRNNESRNQRIGLGTGLLAYMGGDVTNLLVNQIYSRTLNEKLMKMVPQKPDPAIKIDEILEKALDKTNLSNKGVKIIDVSKLADTTITVADGSKKIYTVRGQVENLLKKSFEACPINKKISETKSPLIRKILHNIFSKAAAPFANGQNAGNMLSINTIVLDTKKIGYSGFHEIGHSLNKFSKAGNILQKMRTPVQLVGSAIPIMVALLTNKRTDDNPPVNIWQKTTSFIKENAGKLVTLSFIPIITEEIIATVKGNKLAKEFLPKNIVKQVAKSNAFGAATYIGTAIFAGLAAFTGNKVRDKIVDVRLNKNT